MSRPLLPESAYAELGLPPSVLEDLMNPKPPPSTEHRTVPPPDVVAPNLLESDEGGERPMQPNETSITLYAELLLHVRTVTLFASLRTNHSRETQARASADGSCVTVSHEGESATIRLPFNIKGGGDAALSLPSQPPTKELTLRMQLEETDDTDVLEALNSEDRQANVVPWDGASLNEVGDVVMCCKNCGEVMVQKGKVREWRDLPNENWAEMMDFWHCHKPDESHMHGKEEEEAVGNKGYAAANRLQALEGVGFVDLTSFLFKQEDCDGAQVSHPSIISIRRFPLEKRVWVQRRRPSLTPMAASVDTIALEKHANTRSAILDVSSSSCRWITGVVGQRPSISLSVFP
ncbi:hypothetical protein IAQ61_004601 [Plenodomus lingam]|uniref:uncharacterized protein n=1 Tax=Leptosphaeria maculans TaxID=5022 RepID=UPI0033290789|nr:hypothetical protein IAQ61_004601 [Plenodomus lingam]